MQKMRLLFFALLIPLKLSAIDIIWDPSPDVVTEYRVYEKMGNATYVRLSPLTKITGISYTLPALTSAAHTFVVTAVNGVSESEYSNELVIPKAPGKPSNLRKK